MFETYNGTAVADATENNPDAITDFEKANRTAWDQVITGAGGTIMNTAAAVSYTHLRAHETPEQRGWRSMN